MLHIAIVDDHLMCAVALQAWLADNDPRVQVEYVGSQPAEALAIIDRIDVVVLDADLGCEGCRVGNTVATFVSHEVPVLLLSTGGNRARLREAVLAGASASVTRSSRPESFLESLRAVGRGDHPITRELAEVLCGPAPPGLSDQELRALQLYAQGLTLKGVARTMSISQHTAKEYLDRVRAKYQVQGRTARTRAELQEAARGDGLLDPGG